MLLQFLTVNRTCAIMSCCETDIEKKNVEVYMTLTFDDIYIKYATV